MKVETKNQIGEETDLTSSRELLSRHKSELWVLSTTSYQWWLLVSSNRVRLWLPQVKREIIGRKLGAHRMSRRLRDQEWTRSKTKGGISKGSRHPANKNPFLIIPSSLYHLIKIQNPGWKCQIFRTLVTWQSPGLLGVEGEEEELFPLASSVENIILFPNKMTQNRIGWWRKPRKVANAHHSDTLLCITVGFWVTMQL